MIPRMTRPHFHRIFNRIYLASLALMILFCGWLEYAYCRMYPEEGIQLFTLKNTQLFATNRGFLLLVLPALTTWVIAGLVWLTRRTEPLTDTERQKSFIGRLDAGQLFLPLSWLLLLPLALMIFHAELYTEVWILYLFIGAHLLVTWLMVLFLQRITRIRETVRTVVCVVLFLLAAVAYGFLSTTVFYVCSESPVLSDRTAMDLETDEPGLYDDFEKSLAEAPQELAGEMTQKLLEVYHFYDGDPDLLIETAGPLLCYDPDRRYIRMNLSNRELSPDETERQSQARQANFERKQSLSRFFNWLFDQASFDDESDMYDRIRHLLLLQDGTYDYTRFAKQVDMLDWAYRDLLRQGGEKYGEYEDAAFDIFSEIYEYASHTQLIWENYGGFITDPYVRYTVEQIPADETTLVWAYTFWGRRFNDGRLSACRRMLDKVLEVYPNTLFPADMMERQAASMHKAEARVGDFLKWYKANYWAFRELRAAQYDDAGVLVKLDSVAYGRYVHALRQSGFLAPQLLESLEATAGHAADSTRVDSVTERPGEWLRTDPLIVNYEDIASGIDDLTCRTERILEPARKMCIATSIEGLRVCVENIDGLWLIDKISTKPE